MDPVAQSNAGLPDKVLGIQRPSIGRIVWYQRHGSPSGEHQSEPSPAVITQVFPQSADNMVGLCVWNPNGQYFNPMVKFSAEGLPGTWRWPPRV